MMHTWNQRLLQRMRKRPVANVVKKNGDLCGLQFLVRDFNSLSSQAFHYPAHQVHGAQCVMKAGMNSSGVNKITQSQLSDETQPLKGRV